MSNLSDIILVVHSIFYLLLIILPYIVSIKMEKKLGIYLSWFMTIVIISWLVFKKCLLNNLEGKDIDKYGSIITFLKRYLYIDIPKYSYLISLIFTLLYCYSAYYFSVYNLYHQYFIVLLTILTIYSLYK